MQPSRESEQVPIFEGVDVSVYQGNIDWNKAKADGIEFAIMRAGYGKYVSQKDKYFDQNMKNAKAAGLPCGVYWFSYALSTGRCHQRSRCLL